MDSGIYILGKRSYYPRFCHFEKITRQCGRLKLLINSEKRAFICADRNLPAGYTRFRTVSTVLFVLNFVFERFNLSFNIELLF